MTAFLGGNAKIQLEDLKSSFKSDVVVSPCAQVLKNCVTAACLTGGRCSSLTCSSALYRVPRVFPLVHLFC